MFDRFACSIGFASGKTKAVVVGKDRVRGREKMPWSWYVCVCVKSVTRDSETAVFV